MSDGSDLAWLGLERQREGHWSFELISPLTRHDGKLYGGAGIAVMVATMEAETGRDALWTTVQYAGTADLGQRIDCHTEVLASGRRTSQVRMTAVVDGRVVLAAVGATGASRIGPVEAQIPVMPEVPPPQECVGWEPTGPGHDGDEPTSWFQIAEMRHVPEAAAIWSRMRNGVQTRATLAFLADMVPSSVVRAAGKMGSGTSLDNSMRFGRLVDTDWILLDVDPWFGTGGYLHGAARVWAEDGTLLGVATQTASAMVWEGESPPWVARQQSNTDQQMSFRNR
jgi:acyl-CoA thioesterase